jgi:hypothetical protein
MPAPNHYSERGSVVHLNRQTYSTASEGAIQDRAKQLPGPTIKPLHLHLLDWREVRGVGTERNAWQQHSELKVMEVRRLPHNVFAGQVIAALF